MSSFPIQIVQCLLGFLLVSTTPWRVLAQESDKSPRPQETAEKTQESPSRITDEVIPLQVDRVPRRPAPLLEIGDPFLGQGVLEQGITLPTGAVWNPSFQLYGGFRTGIQSFDDGTTRVSEWANRLDLFANLSLTQTERVLLGLRPLDNGRSFTGYRFEPDNDDGWQDELDLNVEVLFFEGDVGELFPGLDPEDRRTYDLGFAVGRQPLLVQEGLLINDILDAVGVVRNTARPTGITNLRSTALIAWDDIHRDNNREDDSATLLGLFNEADVGASTIAIDLVSTISSDHAGDAIYMGASAVQRIGALNTSLRLNASIPLDGDSPFVSGGVLPFLELSWTPHGSEDLVYINAFWGIDEFASAARGPDTGGPLGRTGILFEAVGLGQFGSALDNRADRVVGGAVGYQWFLDGARRQLIVEAGGRIDTSGDGGSAAAMGLRFQQAIGQRWIIQPNLFGALEEHRDEAFGARLEISVRF